MTGGRVRKRVPAKDVRSWDFWLHLWGHSDEAPQRLTGAPESERGRQQFNSTPCCKDLTWKEALSSGSLTVKEDDRRSHIPHPADIRHGRVTCLDQ